MPFARCTLLVLIPLLLLSCGRDTSIGEQILERGELRFITRNSATTYYVGNSGPRGVEYDLARELATRLGVELVVTQAFSIDELFTALERGEADIAGAGLTLTAEREARFTASTSYGKQHPEVIYKSGERRPRSIEDLRDLRIVVLAGSSHEALLRELSLERYPWLNWEALDLADPVELLLQVNTDQADVAVVDSTDFFVQQTLVPRLAVAFDLAGDRKVVWYLPAAARDDTWLEQVNAYLLERQQDGGIASLRARYFERDESISRVDSQTFLGSVHRSLPRYQALIETVARNHQLPWELLAAISYQESHWDPKAVSPTGVKGMMMLTQATAQDLDIRDRTDPAQSLRGGARYFKELRRRLPGDILEPDRSWLALGAYNIGMGHLEDARVLAERSGGDPHLWSDVMKALPLLEDEAHYSTVRYGYARGTEAVRYVQNIRHYFNVLRWQSAREDRPLPPQDIGGLLPPALERASLHAL